MSARAGDRAAPEAIPITRGDVPAVAEAVARGFDDNEVWVWLLPGEGARARVLRRHYRLVLRWVFIPCGTAWTTADRAGAALWFPNDRPHSGRDDLVETISVLPHLGAVRRGIAIDRAFALHQPSEPHWYLSVLAVDPGRQRGGLGSALMRPGLDRCDADGLPAYLESNREANLPFYRRFGFELAERVQIPGGPPVWLMWRQPR